MFGGIIDTIGLVHASIPAHAGRTLVLAAQDYWTDTPLGASIAVDGVCLTLTRVDADRASFDLHNETLQTTTLSSLRPGNPVNLQKSLALGQRIDGHFVQGHVDAIATIAKIEQAPPESKWWFSIDPDKMPCIIPKGSVAIDGISLTIADVRTDRFSVALIPTTLAQTTLGQKKTGARVNIETDIITRTVVNHLRSITNAPESSHITEGLLKRHGFA